MKGGIESQESHNPGSLDTRGGGGGSASVQGGMVVHPVLKRYLIVLALGLVGLVAAFAAPFILSGDDGRPSMLGWVLFFVLLSGTCLGLALEKGRIFLWMFAPWIAPLMIVILLLPHTKARRTQLMEPAVPFRRP